MAGTSPFADTTNRGGVIRAAVVGTPDDAPVVHRDAVAGNGAAEPGLGDTGSACDTEAVTTLTTQATAATTAVKA